MIICLLFEGKLRVFEAGHSQNKKTVGAFLSRMGVFVVQIEFDKLKFDCFLLVCLDKPLTECGLWSGVGVRAKNELIVEYI
jgi:hypothetical protein